MQMFSGAGSGGTGGAAEIPFCISTENCSVQTSPDTSALPTGANSTEEKRTKRTSSRIARAHLEISSTALVPVVCEQRDLRQRRAHQGSDYCRTPADNQFVVCVGFSRVLAHPWHPNTEVKWNVGQLIPRLWSHPYLSKLHYKNSFMPFFCSSFELFTHSPTASIYHSCFSIHSLPSNPHYNSFPSFSKTCYFSLSILPSVQPPYLIFSFSLSLLLSLLHSKCSH